MAEPNIQHIEDSLRKANKRSWMRFYIFLALILVLWVSTYIITKGEFNFITKKVNVIDTLVIDQSALIKSKDSTINDLVGLNKILQERVSKDSAKLASMGAVRPTPNPTQVADVVRIKEKLRLRELEQRRQDSLIKLRKEQYQINISNSNNLNNIDIRQEQIKK
jgi:hypothetical protein